MSESAVPRSWGGGRAKILASRLALALPVLLLAPIYGVWPLDHLMSLGLIFPALGAIECLASTGTWLYCPLASLGERHATSYGLPMVQLVSLVHRIGGFPLPVSWNLTGLVVLYLAGLGAQAFFRAMGVSAALAVFGSILFLALPVVWAKNNYPLMLWGFALLPLLLWMQYKAWQLNSHLAAFVLLIVALTLGLFQEPYSLVMALTFGGWLALVKLTGKRSRGLRFALVRTGLWIVACLLAVFLYRLYVPGGADYQTMPLDFFRGQGIDLIALIARDPQLYWLGPFWGVGRLSPVLFFTDGEMTAHSYLGLGFVLGLIIFLFSQAVWRSQRRMVLLLTLLGALVMALGPSLKVNSTADDRSPDDPITMQTYLMPAEAAVMDLPHQFVYELPPFNAMRSVSRWYLLVALMLVTMLMLGVQSFQSRGPVQLVLAALLLLGVALEHWPNTAHRMALSGIFGNLYRQIENDLVEELQQMLRPEERVVFVGGERLNNEFFSTFLCARVGCSTYNASTDKAFAIARASWPDDMRARLLRPAAPAVRAELLQRENVDALVLTHFNLRWDSYSWPPSSERRERMLERWVSPYLEVESVDVNVGYWFSVIRAEPGPRSESDDS